MKNISSILQAAFLALLILQCTPANDTLSELPELPSEFVDNLAPSTTAPVLMTNLSQPAPEKPQIKDSIALLAPGKSCVRLYWVQVIYPITICYPPNELFDDLVAQASLPSKSKSNPKDEQQLITPQKAKFYKLSSFHNVNFSIPYWCTVHGGPWYGIIEETTSCSPGIPNMYKFFLVGVPEPIVVTWHGELGDFPLPPSMQIIDTSDMFSESCTCCGSLKLCPDGRCIPFNIDCNPGNPF